MPVEVAEAAGMRGGAGGEQATFPSAAAGARQAVLIGRPGLAGARRHHVLSVSPVPQTSLDTASYLENAVASA